MEGYLVCRTDNSSFCTTNFLPLDFHLHCNSLVMNFLEVRNNIAHMLHEDPLGIENPPINDPNEGEKIVNHSALDMTNPVGNIECEWFDDHVSIYDPDKDTQFSIAYENRTEGEISSEVVKIFDYLS